jgi:hypothetical protein
MMPQPHKMFMGEPQEKGETIRQTIIAALNAT